MKILLIVIVLSLLCYVGYQSTFSVVNVGF